MKSLILFLALTVSFYEAGSWGFFAHRKINMLAVFLLPPEMLRFYKQHIDVITAHAVDPDKRRYAIKEEGPRHYIDLDHYGMAPYDSLPRNWNLAIEKYTEDTLQAYGIVPWWIQKMHYRLTEAFKAKDPYRILKVSAELGHYIADAHVPLHTSSNHNGQLTGQQGIHGFWESRLPELLAEKEWDFFLTPATYLKDPLQFIWERVLESAAATDSVLSLEKKLSAQFSPDRKYAFEERNGLLVRNYSTAYSNAYNRLLNHMPEKRMQLAVFSVASFWYTAWVNAGQPTLEATAGRELPVLERMQLESLDSAWRAGRISGKSCENP